MTARHAYDLGGDMLAVSAEAPELLAGFEHFLGDRRRPACADPAFAVSIAVGEPASLPPDASLLYQGPLPGEGDCAFACRENRYFLVFAGEASLEIVPDQARAAMIVAPGSRYRAAGTMASMTIEFAYDHGGRQLLHGAGLAIAETGRMLFVSAPSGTGKTTTALALARNGFALASDDVVAVRRGATGLMAQGLPRALNVHRNSAAMLPWLPVGPDWRTDGEQALPWRRLGDTLALEDRELPLAAVLLLRRGPAPRIAPVAATEALVALASDNVRGSMLGLTPLHARRYAMLADMVRSLPAWQVEVGEGLDGIESIAAGLRSLLAEEAP